MHTNIATADSRQELNVSTMVAQFIDSVIVYIVAFWGVIPNVFHLIVVAWVVKVVVASLDTPFIYLLRKYQRPDAVGAD